jgi:hypothetical protein
MASFEFGGVYLKGDVSNKMLTGNFSFCNGDLGRAELIQHSKYTIDGFNVLKLEMEFKKDTLGQNTMRVDLGSLGYRGETFDAVEVLFTGRPKPDPRIIVVTNIPL